MMLYLLADRLSIWSYGQQPHVRWLKDTLFRDWIAKYIKRVEFAIEVSRAVREAILEHKPVVCLTGHIHEGRGIDSLGRTTVLNPGPLRAGRYARVRMTGGRCDAGLVEVCGERMRT